MNSTDELLVGVGPQTEKKHTETIEISDSQEEDPKAAIIEEKRNKAAEIRRKKQEEKKAKVSLKELLDFDPTTLDTLDDFTNKFDAIAEKLLNDVCSLENDSLMSC